MHWDRRGTMWEIGQVDLPKRVGLFIGFKRVINMQERQHWRLRNWTTLMLRQWEPAKWNMDLSHWSQVTSHSKQWCSFYFGQWNVLAVNECLGPDAFKKGSHCSCHWLQVTNGCNFWIICEKEQHQWMSYGKSTTS